MKFDKILGIFILCSVFFFSSCSLLTSPEDTVGPPRKESDISADNTDINNVIRGFIKSEDKIISLDEKDKSKGYYLMDIDGDKCEEVIALYEHLNTFPEYHLLVLKKGDKNWTKLYEEDLFSKEPVKSIEFKDLTGDNIPEVVVMYGDNNLVVYGSCGELGNKFGGCISAKCSEYKIADLVGRSGPDGMLELYCKNSDPDEFDTVIYRWNGVSFSYVVNEFPDYYLESLNSLTKRLSTDPDNYSIALRVMENQLRFDMKEEALKTAEKVLGYLKDIEYKNHLLGLKARALLNLGQYEQARTAANDAIKAGEELMEYAKKTKSSVTAPGSYYDVIADSYVAEKEYDKAKEIIKLNTKLPYAEAAQEIDALIARDKICSYIKNSKAIPSNNLIKDIVKWGQDNNIIINCVTPENPESIFSFMFVIDYHINPSIAYGKENVGGHIIYWREGENSSYMYSPTIKNMNSFPLISDLVAETAKITLNNKQIKLQVTYKNAKSDNYMPKSYTQYFLYENNNFKLAYK